MDRLPTVALLEAGYLRAQCDEPTILICSACGVVGSDDMCQACFCTAGSVRSCQRCQERLELSPADGERACHSVSAYEQSSRLPAFAAEEGLWACKKASSDATFVLGESELRRRFADGRLAGGVLLRGLADQDFSPASERSEFPELQELARVAQKKAEQEAEKQLRRHRAERERAEAAAAARAKELRLEALERRRERDRERSTRELESEAKADRALEEERRRLFVERLERERLEAETADAAARAMRRSARWWSTAAVALISVAVWNLPFVQETRFRNWFAHGAGKQKDAAAPPSATSPEVSAGTSATVVQQAPTGNALTATPVFSGYVTDNFSVLLESDSAYLSGRFERLAASGIKARLVVVETTGSESIQDFGARVGNTWNAAREDSRSDLLISVASKDRTIRIDLTKTLNDRLTDQEAMALIDGHFQPVAARAGLQQGLRALADQLERVLWAKAHATSGEAEVQEQTNNAMGEMLTLISNWDGRATTFAPASQATWDSSIARLESLPRPARGDRKAARQLHAQGLAMIGQQGLEPLAIEKLTLAHQSDPLDVQVVNDLAFAQLTAGQYRESVANIRKTFRLAPTRIHAWINLAEALPFVVKSPEEAKNVAALCYVLGYYFSKDRAKTTEYLRNKIDATDTKEEVRAVAREALQRIEGFVQADPASPEAQTTTTGPAARTAPTAEAVDRDRSSDVQGQIAQAENALQRRDLAEARRLVLAALELDRLNDSVRALLKRVEDSNLESLRQATVIK